MGIDLIAHIGVKRTDLNQAAILNDLNVGCDGVKHLVAEWFGTQLPKPPPLPARWEPLSHTIGRETIYSLWVRGGNCILSVMPKRAELYVGTKWDCIWWHPEFRHLLRKACFDLAQMLGSEKAVYTPEVVHEKGQTLDEVIDSIRQERGDPAPTFDALQDVEMDLYSAKGCYYIDTFDDLKK